MVSPGSGSGACAASSSSASCITARTCSSTSSTSGSSPNCAAMSIGSSTWVTILVGSGRLGGKTTLRPNGKPNDRRQNLRCAAAFEPQPLGQPGAAGQVELGLLPADGHRGHDRHAGLDRRPDVAGAAVEVDDVLRAGWAGRRRSRRRGTPSPRRRTAVPRGVLAVGADEAGAPEEVAGGPGDEDVVAQRVDRAVVAEFVVEARR